MGRAVERLSQRHSGQNMAPCMKMVAVRVENKGINAKVSRNLDFG